MTSGLDDLDGSVVAYVDADVGREWDLGKAKGPWVWGDGWTGDLEGRNHGQTHVERCCAQAQVEVDEGRLVAGEPAGLEGDRTALEGPLCSVGAGYCSAAWKKLLVFFFFG